MILPASTHTVQFPGRRLSVYDDQRRRLVHRLLHQSFHGNSTDMLEAALAEFIKRRSVLNQIYDIAPRQSVLPYQFFEIRHRSRKEDRPAVQIFCNV